MLLYKLTSAKAIAIISFAAFTCQTVLAANGSCSGTVTSCKTSPAVQVEKGGYFVVTGSYGYYSRWDPTGFVSPRTFKFSIYDSITNFELATGRVTSTADLNSEYISFAKYSVKVKVTGEVAPQGRYRPRTVASVRNGRK